MIVVGSKLRW